MYMMESSHTSADGDGTKGTAAGTLASSASSAEHRNSLRLEDFDGYNDADVHIESDGEDAGNNGNSTTPSTNQSKRSMRFRHSNSSSSLAGRLRSKVSSAAKKTQERSRLFRSNVVQKAKKTGDRVREKVNKKTAAARSESSQDDEHESYFTSDRDSDSCLDPDTESVLRQYAPSESSKEDFDRDDSIEMDNTASTSNITSDPSTESPTHATVRELFTEEKRTVERQPSIPNDPPSASSDEEIDTSQVESALTNSLKGGTNAVVVVAKALKTTSKSVGKSIAHNLSPNKQSSDNLVPESIQTKATPSTETVSVSNLPPPPPLTEAVPPVRTGTIIKGQSNSIIDHSEQTHDDSKPAYLVQIEMEKHAQQDVTPGKPTKPAEGRNLIRRQQSGGSLEDSSQPEIQPVVRKSPRRATKAVVAVAKAIRTRATSKGKSARKNLNFRASSSDDLNSGRSDHSRSITSNDVTRTSLAPQLPPFENVVSERADAKMVIKPSKDSFESIGKNNSTVSSPRSTESNRVSEAQSSVSYTSPSSDSKIPAQAQPSPTPSKETRKAETQLANRRRTPKKTAKAMAAAVGRSIARNIGGRRKSSNDLFGTDTIVDGSPPPKISATEASHYEQPSSPEKIAVRGSLKKNSSVSMEISSEVKQTLDILSVLMIVVVMVALDQLYVGWQDIQRNGFPLASVVSLMSVAFIGGIRMDTQSIILRFEQQFLGIKLRPYKREINEVPPSVPRPEPTIIPSQPQTPPVREESRAEVRRGRERPKGRRSYVPTTSLSQSESNLLRHIGRISKLPAALETSLLEGDVRDSVKFDKSATVDSCPSDEKEQTLDPTIGTFSVDEARANKLSKDAKLKPIFELRGMDVFLSDDAEEEAGTHPFLIQNGLRNVPTFIFNVMTQWGNVLLYFKMPDWVKDFDKSLKERDTDDEATVALKRFLKGDDAYRRERLKIVPCIVAAPMPIKILAPKDAVLVIHRHKLVDSIYNEHEADAKNNSCVTLEVTVDLMGNQAIRGMASIVKRYVQSIALDIAIVLRKPGRNDPKVPAEPEAVLGLWGLKHLDLSQCDQKPDRYEGNDPAAIEESEALLALKYARMAKRTPSSSSL